MKFIFSRKGFDSSWGGHACPILPDGTLLMLPIPVRNDEHTDADKVRYSDLRIAGSGKSSLLEVMLSHGITRLRTDKETLDLTHTTRCHLDPDLVPDYLPKRSLSWRAAFGQSDTAEGHLRKQNVGLGD